APQGAVDGDRLPLARGQRVHRLHRLALLAVAGAVPLLRPADARVVLAALPADATGVGVAAAGEAGLRPRPAARPRRPRGPGDRVQDPPAIHLPGAGLVGPVSDGEKRLPWPGRASRRARME